MVYLNTHPYLYTHTYIRTLENKIREARPSENSGSLASNIKSDFVELKKLYR